MAWQSDLARLIVAEFVSPAQPEGHVWTEGTSVVLGPPKDDDVVNDLVIGLVDRQGPIDETFTHVYGRPNLTVVLRSGKRGMLDGFDIAQDLFLWLTRPAHANFTMGSTPVQRVDPMAWPGYLRGDEHHRVLITMEVGMWLGAFDV